MNRSIPSISSFTAATLLALSACTVAKLEARLEANPQCKDVINPKTGALMPCPGTDRAFYVAAGVEAPRPAKTVVAAPAETNAVKSATNTTATPTAANAPAVSPSNTAQTSAECKPQIHKKSGGLIPCLPPE